MEPLIKEGTKIVFTDLSGQERSLQLIEAPQEETERKYFMRNELYILRLAFHRVLDKKPDMNVADIEMVMMAMVSMRGDLSYEEKKWLEEKFALYLKK